MCRKKKRKVLQMIEVCNVNDATEDEQHSNKGVIIEELDHKTSVPDKN